MSEKGAGKNPKEQSRKVQDMTKGNGKKKSKKKDPKRPGRRTLLHTANVGTRATFRTPKVLCLSHLLYSPSTAEPWPDRLVRGPLFLPLLRILRTPYSRLQTPSCAPESVRPRHRLLPAIARLEKAGPFPLSWYLCDEEKEGGMTMMNLSTYHFALFPPSFSPLLRLLSDSQRIGFPHL